MRHTGILTVSVCLIAIATSAQSTVGSRFGFNRIIPGWTNYSTAFTTTDDGDEFATVANFFTPAVDVATAEFGAVVVWFSGTGGTVDFGDFTFRVFVWSGLNAFVANPRHGDVATFSFPAPTGGSTTVPDSRTRGGRNAYHVRFALTNASLILTQCHTYLIGLATVSTSGQAGELFVPTAPFAGDSDVQAGNIVPFGWTYLLNSGGPTIYYGQLATELRVRPLGDPPAIQISALSGELLVTWPEKASCYTLQSADALLPDGWIPASNVVIAGNHARATGVNPSVQTRYFRLNRATPSVFAP